MATVKIIGFCTPDCTEHIQLEITHGKEVRQILTTKSELKAVAGDMDEVANTVMQNIRTYCRLSGLTDWDQLKTALEMKTFNL